MNLTSVWECRIDIEIELVPGPSIKNVIFQIHELTWKAKAFYQKYMILFGIKTIIEHLNLATY